MISEPFEEPGRHSQNGDVRTACILYVWPYIEWGGAQIYMMALMQGARERGIAASVLMPRSTPATLHRMLLKDGVSIEGFTYRYDFDPATSLRRRLLCRLRKWRAELAILAHIWRHDPRRTLVHIDIAPWASPWFYKALLMRFRVFVTVHTALATVTPLRRALWRRRIRSLAAHPRFRLLTSNSDVHASLAEYLLPEQRSRVRECPSCFVKEEIEGSIGSAPSRAALEQRLGLAPSAFRIVVGAQFLERKGCFVLIDALRRLAAENKIVDCLWISPSPPAVELLRAIETARLGTSFQCRTQADLGGTRKDYLAAVFRIADLFVLPSLIEGLPMALVEAMALGKACVATRINAIRELITHGETGWLVPPGDAGSLADILHQVERNPNSRERVAAAGRSYVYGRYERAVATAGTLDAYDEVLKASPE